MKLTSVGLAVALGFAPAAVFAHGDPPKPAHGGQVQEIQENWVELVIGKDVVTLYVNDQKGTPVSASKVFGTATVLVGGKPYKVELTPGSENQLEGKLPVAASGKLAATVSLKIEGKSGSGRFTFAK